MIPIQNIYYMLSYAFQVLNEQGYKSVATEHFENVADLCAAILIKGLSKQLKRGLMKDYIPKREPLTALRGKMEISSRSFNAIKNENERMKFVLAAYNAGIGHVLDAMALAEKYGKNKYVWDNSVDDYILLKSNEEYFNDPVCKNGYFRGVETYNFVKEVMSRGEVYKKKIKD